MRSEAIPILTYHSVGPGDGGALEPYRTEPDVFSEHVAALVSSPRRWVTVGELGRRLADGRSVAGLGAITFDDPFADAVRHAVPALSDVGVPSTVYALSRGLGAAPTFLAEGPRLASVEELRALPDGVELGAHGCHHLELDVLPAARAEAEIAASRVELAELVDRPIDTFAYPHGYRSPRLKAAVQRAGYIAACGVRNCLSHRDDDRFSLARVLVTRSHGADDVALLAEGVGWPLARRHDSPLTVGWRCVRRARRRLRR